MDRNPGLIIASSARFYSIASWKPAASSSASCSPVSSQDESKTDTSSHLQDLFQTLAYDKVMEAMKEEKETNDEEGTKSIATELPVTVVSPQMLKEWHYSLKSGPSKCYKLHT